MAIEELLTLYALLAGASDPIRKLSNVHSKLQRAAAASDRICDLMDREPQVVERPAAIDLPGTTRRSSSRTSISAMPAGRPCSRASR